MPFWLISLLNSPCKFTIYTFLATRSTNTWAHSYCGIDTIFCGFSSCVSATREVATQLASNSVSRNLSNCRVVKCISQSSTLSFQPFSTIFRSLICVCNFSIYSCTSATSGTQTCSTFEIVSFFFRIMILFYFSLNKASTRAWSFG